MKYATGAAFRAALESRLMELARERGKNVGRLRKAVVFDRLLARLSEVAPAGWVLKGGFALELRLEQGARSTRDVDLGRRDSEEQATEDFQDVVNCDLGDFFEFQIERVAAGDEIAVGGGVRYRAIAFLGAREFERVTIDVGFLDPVAPNPERLSGPDLLAFADIQPAVVPTAPLEQHLAEKLHAYTRTYGAGVASSRSKDLVDIVLIARIAEFDARMLRTAIEQTFSLRATHMLPAAFPQPPRDWAPSYRRLAEEVGVDPSLESATAAARTFLAPVISGELTDGRWMPEAGEWSAARKRSG